MTLPLSAKLSWVGLASGLTCLLVINPALAQLDVIGGGVTINDADTFVPADGTVTGTIPLTNRPATSPDNRTVIYSGDLDTTTLTIDTNQGNVPADALFRVTTLPVIADLTDAEFMGGSGLVGSTGNIGGTLSFRAIGAGGATFFNIPTTLEFQVADTSAAPLNPTAFTEFRSERWMLTETGFVTDVSGFGVVQRQRPVFLVQYQPDGTAAQNQIVLNNVVPATAYSAERQGTSYDIDNLDLSFTGGVIETPPGFNLEGAAPATDAAILVTSAITSTSRVEAVSIFNDVAIIVLPSFDDIVYDDDVDVEDENEDGEDGDVGVNPNDGSNQFVPVLPRFVFVGVFVFTNVPSGRWVDPPSADGFEYEMVPRDIPVGVASRVFPGMTGVGQADDSVFTQISGFPTGVDADDTFIVSVDDTVLGEFSPGDTLQFSDYADVLGDRLINGGVEKFTITEINPAVDSANPVAFPLQLDFNTPTASFEMRALETTASGDETQVSSNSLESIDPIE